MVDASLLHRIAQTERELARLAAKHAAVADARERRLAELDARLASAAAAHTRTAQLLAELRALAAVPPPPRLVSRAALAACVRRKL